MGLRAEDIKTESELVLNKHLVGFTIEVTDHLANRIADEYGDLDDAIDAVVNLWKQQN